MAAKAAAALVTKAYVYVTFLASDGDESCKAVAGLAKALHKVGSAYPLVVAVLPDVPESRRRILISHGCIVREVEPVHPPNIQAQFAIADPDYVAIHSKLRIWEFVEYERMVYLDSAMQVLQNIDDLFELEKGHLYATRGWYPELRPSQAPYFNTDMFVHEPSVATAKAMLDTLWLKPTPNLNLPRENSCFTDFLNVFFRNQHKPTPLDDKLVLAMQPCLRLPDQNVQPFKNLIATAKKGIFAHNNMPAMATFAASSAVLGGIASSRSPAICFSFYVVFIVAISVVTISLRRRPAAEILNADGYKWFPI